MHAYKITEFNWEYVQTNKDMGFNIFQMVLKKYTDNPQVMVFTTALITNVLIVATLYKYSRLIELSLYVYITSGMYLTSMNGIRQYLAAAIIFAATKYIFEGKMEKIYINCIMCINISCKCISFNANILFVRKKPGQERHICSFFSGMCSNRF